MAAPRYWRIDDPAPGPGGFTVADLPGLAVDLPYELVDGEILLSAPRTQWHPPRFRRHHQPGTTASQ